MFILLKTMKQIELLKRLPSDILVIWGSYAIKQQDKNFRDPQDIDIMFKQEYAEFIKFLSEKDWWTVKEEWHYELEVLFLTKDGIEIHCIPVKELPTKIIKKDGFNLLLQDEVYEYKKKLLAHYERWTSQFEKHLYDIWYSINKKSGYFESTS